MVKLKCTIGLSQYVHWVEMHYLVVSIFTIWLRQHLFFVVFSFMIAVIFYLLFLCILFFIFSIFWHVAIWSSQYALFGRVNIHSLVELRFGLLYFFIYDCSCNLSLFFLWFSFLFFLFSFFLIFSFFVSFLNIVFTCHYLIGSKSTVWLN